MKQYKEVIIYVIFILVVVIWLITQTQPKVAELIGVEQGIKTKSIEASELERKLETLKAAELEKNAAIGGQTKKIYKPDEPGLDAESSFTVPFDDIIEMAKYNGIKVRSIEYVYNPATDEFVKGAADKYNVCQLNMQIIADYADLQSFIKEVYRYPYLVKFDKIEITPYEKNKKILLVVIQLKLYSEK